jgi:hypothetical protein
MQRNKALVSIVLLLGFVIIGGIALLGYGLFEKANNPDFKFFKNVIETPNNKIKTYDKNSGFNTSFSKNISILLAKEEWVHEIMTSENKIIVHITSKSKNDRLLILDADNGSIISKINFKRSK